MRVGLTVCVPDVGTLIDPPGHESLARLALLADHLKVVLPPISIAEYAVINKFILGTTTGSRTVMVTELVAVRPLASVIVKR